MQTKPQECDVPHASLIAKRLAGASFYDAWSVVSNHPERSSLEHFLAAAERTPRWVNTAMTARNRIVQRLGLKNLGTLSEFDRTRSPESYQPGERIGIFTLFEVSFDEVLFGDRDKHLDVVLSVYRRPLTPQSVEVTLTTIVHVKNWLGRIYMLPVTPAHRRIVPAVLTGLAA